MADALRRAGASIEVHIDHFAPAAPDLEWIPEVGKRGWVLITRDANIRRNPLERAAYEAAGVRGFVVTGKDMGGPDLAALLVRSLRGMVNRAAGKAGAIAVHDFLRRDVYKVDIRFGHRRKIERIERAAA